MARKKKVIFLRKKKGFKPRRRASIKVLSPSTGGTFKMKKVRFMPKNVFTDSVA